MSVYLKRIFFLAIFQIVSIYCYAQCNNSILENYSQSSGLSQSTINCIFQDSEGFIWLGTQGGLNCFNGYSIRVFKNDPINQNSLSGDFITAIEEDGNGNIWVGTTNAGISVYEKKSSTWKRYRFSDKDISSLSDDRITSIFKDNNNRLWIGTQNGLNLFLPLSNSFKHYYKYSLSSGNTNCIISITQDNDKNIFFLTNYFLGKIDIKSDILSTFSIPNIPVVFAWYQNILIDNENLWFFIDSQSLCRYNLKLNKFFTVKLPYRLFNELSRYVITKIVKSGDKLFFTTYGNGIKSFNPKNNSFSDLHFGNLPQEEEELKNTSTMLYDKQSILWIGTSDKGVFKYDPLKIKFRHYKKDPLNSNSLSDNLIWQIHEDKEGKIWFRTNLSLERYDRSTNIYKKFRFSTNGIFENKNRDLIISENNSAYKFNFKTQQFEKLFNWTDFLGFKRETIIYRILEDKNNNYWLASNLGLIKYNLENKKVHIYRNNPHNSKSISDNSITYLFESSKGDLWISTANGGLNRYNRTDDNFERFLFNPSDPLSILNKKVYPVCEDEYKQIWVGTIGGGVYVIDSTGKVIKNYNTKDGLPDNSIAGIVIDNRSIWISTFRGLCKMSFDNDNIKNFDLSDGLQSLDFNVLSCERCSDGLIFFGGVNGYNTFYTDKINYNKYIPPVKIIKFIKTNRPNSQETELPISKVINLDYTENMFQIEFTALNYSNTEKNLFKYKLEGFDESWTYCGTRRFAQYTNLDPGEYTFIVKGSNNDGYWNEEGASIIIIIKPPFWKTWWAYFSYAMLAIALFISLFKIDRKRYFRKQDEKLKQEREKAKLIESELRLKTTELEMKAAKAQAIAAETQAKMLRAESERKSEEFEEARKLQLSMLPKNLPESEFIDFAVYNKTASEVGGDYYDFILGDDEKILMAFGDATGHGMKAGTMVSIIKSLFIMESPWNNFPLFFTKCTNILKKMHLGNMYMGLSITSIQERQLKISSAGMPPIFVYHRDMESIEEIRFRSMPLGAYENFVYEEKTFNLKTGDTILFLTDGLPDQFNDNKETLDYKPIEDTFRKHADSKPDYIIKMLLELWTSWSQNKQQTDDITIMVLKIK